jgi:hypothetical protein
MKKLLLLFLLGICIVNFAAPAWAGFQGTCFDGPPGSPAPPAPPDGK